MNRDDGTPDLPNWMRQMSGSGETPEWLRRLVSQPEGELDFADLDSSPEEMGFETAEPEPAAPSDSGEADDWFAGLEEPSAASRDEPPALVDTGKTDDWLTALDEAISSEPQTSADEDGALDWLARLEQEESTSPGAQVDEEVADETAEPFGDGLSAESEVALAEEPAARPVGETVPDWLSSLALEGSEEEEVSLTPGEEPSSEQPLPDWLSGLEQESQPEPEATSAPSEDASSEQAVPDWLAGLEEGSPGPTEEPAAEPVAESVEESGPDWMSGLEQESPGEEGALPVLSEEPSLSEEGVPGWLAGLEEGALAQADQEVPTSAEEPVEMPEWLSGLDEGAPVPQDTGVSIDEGEPGGAADLTEDALVPSDEAGMPDWLTTVESGAAQDEVTEGPPEWLPGVDEAPPTGKVPKPTEAPPTEEGAAEGLPDWMASDDVAEIEGVPSQVPDWLQDAESSAVEGGAGGVPSWLIDMDADEPSDAAPEPEETAPPEVTSGIPDWLAPVEPDTDIQEGDEEQAVAPSMQADTEPGESEVQAEPEQGLPEWLKDMGEVAMVSGAVAAQGVTEGLQDGQETPVPEGVESEETPGKDQIPSWLSDIDIGAPAEPAEPEIALEVGAQVPDWLREIPPEPGQQASVEDAPATLGEPLVGTPSWMQDAYGAEEPEVAEDTLVLPTGEGVPAGETPDWIEALRTEEQKAEAQVLPVETSGPLAGLRGVLNPEPLLAILPKSTYRPVPPVTDAQRAEAALVEQVITGPAHRPTEVLSPGREILASLGRWVMYLALALMILAAPLQSLVRLPDPPEAQSFYHAVDRLQAGKHVLLVIDYDASLEGELTPQTRAVIRHLLQKNLGVVALSLTPQGVGIVQDLFAEVPSAIEGEHYVNLGYLPAHPASLQAFMNNPLGGAVLLGPQGVEVAQTTLGQRIAQFENLDLVIAFSGNQEHVRWWIEQVGSQTQVDMLAGVSASIAPFVQPYYGERASAQIKGLLVGLGAAAKYEELTGLTVMPSAWANYVVLANAQILLVAVVMLGGLGSLLFGLARRLRGST